MKLREDETLLISANAHWSSFPVAALVALLCLGLSFSMLIDGTHQGKSTPSIIFFFVVGTLTILRIIIGMRSTHFFLTSKRLLVEKGILGKTQSEVVLRKINDMQLKTSALFRSGAIAIHVGNDKPILVGPISNYEEFKNILSTTLEKQ